MGFDLCRGIVAPTRQIEPVVDQRRRNIMVGVDNYRLPV
jgi:hypothetical protein